MWKGEESRVEKLGTLQTRMLEEVFKCTQEM